VGLRRLSRSSGADPVVLLAFQTIETHDQKLAFTRHEPVGVVGQIIPCKLSRRWRKGNR